MMCAEAVAWRCHRSAIGDALVARSLGWIEHFRSERRIFDDLHQQIETAIRNQAITRRKMDSLRKELLLHERATAAPPPATRTPPY